MAYTVTITDITNNVGIQTNTQPITVSYNSVSVKGDKGDTGATGNTGPAGPQGTSITATTVNGSGNLIVTLSDSSSIDSGHVVLAQLAQQVLLERQGHKDLKAMLVIPDLKVPASQLKVQ